MKLFYKTLLVAVAAIVSSCTTDAEDESDSFDAAKVCPESGRGTFTDDRDGQVYKYTTIGNQVWMAENLKYDAEYSVCLESYRESSVKVYQNFCEDFGRFYTLQKKGSYLEKIDESFATSVCPEGWRIPSIDEWTEMIESIGSMNSELTSRRLRDSEYWTFGGAGTDDCAFSVHPAGAYTGDVRGLSYFGFDAIFWTSTVDSLGQIKTIKISNDILVFNNLPKMSIRCVKD